MDQTGRFLSSIIHRRWTAVNGFSVAADRLTAIAAAWIFDSFRERARYPRPGAFSRPALSQIWSGRYKSAILFASYSQRREKQT